MIKLNAELLEKIALNIDIDIGDIVLGGRFKNKRMEVKKFGTDDLGQPTINGRKLLTVRIEKKLPINKQSSKTREEKDMNKESMLNQIYENSFNDEVQKMAGIRTEFLGNAGIGAPFGALAAAMTPTKTDEQMKKQEKKTWSNMLLPGVGTYRTFKRMGHSRKKIKELIEKDDAKAKAK